MKKAITIVLILIMSISAENKIQQSEQEHFRRAGYNIKHYRIAQGLSLDVLNYEQYCIGKKERVTGGVMLGVGAGLFCSGTISIISAAANSGDNNSYNTGFVSGESSHEDYTALNIATGSVIATSGTIVLLVGAIKHSKGRRRTVLKKDGSQFSWGLAPHVDPIGNRFGAQLALNF